MTIYYYKHMYFKEKKNCLSHQHYRVYENFYLRERGAF
jgi:hypothetical protein